MRLFNKTKKDLMTYQKRRGARLDLLDTGELTLHLEQKRRKCNCRRIGFQVTCEIK